MSAFMEAWGYPDRTRVVDAQKLGYYSEWVNANADKGENNVKITTDTSKQGVSIDGAGAKAGLATGKYESGFKSKLQEWEYKKYDMLLYFNDDNDLVDWKSDRTVKELRDIYENSP